MKGSLKMINLINADKILKQLYLSIVMEELNKTKEQQKVIEQKEQKEKEKDETLAQGPYRGITA